MVCVCLYEFFRFFRLVLCIHCIGFSHILWKIAGCLADIELTCDDVSDKAGPILLGEVDLAF
jgi:hypothetical protein